MDPFDIVRLVSRFTIPRIEIKEPTTLAEALHFIFTRYDDIQIQVEEPNKRLTFDVRLPAETLAHPVSFQGRNITMINALKLALHDLPVTLTFEPGKLIFSELPNSKGAAAEK